VSKPTFLLSPVNLSGKRGKQIMNPQASFALAKQLQSVEGAALGEVFMFVSGLYFRGKVAYARAFGQAALVMTAGGGLLPLETLVTLPRLQGWQSVDISEKNPHFTGPLVREASMLADGLDAEARVVLLGSVASNKYVAPLLDVFGDRLLFPERFAGLGDMSRGALMLDAARDGQELSYLPVASARSLSTPRSR
jgi:hypothetical protein